MLWNQKESNAGKGKKTIITGWKAEEKT
jgi:hypothetical protein